MASPLSPCPVCFRHVRVTERACPFCASPLEIVGYSSHTSHLREQAAAVFVGVTLAIAGCNARTEQTNTNTTDVKPVLPEVKTPETKPAAVLAPSSMVTPPPIDPDVSAVPAYGLAPPPPPPVYVTPHTGKPKPDPERFVPKYGAPPPPFKPMKP
jgi:hypothetical protein